MSYILEALKRAEKERKLGEAPAALDEIAIPQVNAGQVRQRWLLIGAGGVLLVAAIVYGAVALFRGKPAAEQPIAAAPAVTTQPQAQQAPAAAPAFAPAPADAELAAAAQPSADAKIEGGEKIASLDDLTGDTGADANADAAANANPGDENLPPSGPAVDLGSSEALRTTPAPPPPSSSSSPSSAAALATPAPTGKPTIYKPEFGPSPRAKVSPSIPSPPPAKRAATPAPAPAAVASVKGPRAPPAGPVVVLGNEPKVIEAAPPPARSSASARTRPPSSPAQRTVEIPAEVPPGETASSTPAAEPAPEPQQAAKATEIPPQAAIEPPAPPVATPVEKPAPPPARAAARSEPVRPTTRTAPPQAATASRERADRLDSLRRFKEMAPAYRAEFPPLTVDVHVYNADAQRSFVIVNGKRYRAGDALAEGPRIDEIVSEGIVFDWRNEKVLYTLGR